MEHLEEHPLLDAADRRSALEVGVAHDRVRDGPEGRHDRVDEAGLARPAVRTSTRVGLAVDQVVDDRLGGPDLLAPAVGRLADDLVGVLALGQPDDAGLVELMPVSVGCDLADQLLELPDPERARALAGRVDVVGERDPSSRSG